MRQHSFQKLLCSEERVTLVQKQVRARHVPSAHKGASSQSMRPCYALSKHGMAPDLNSVVLLSFTSCMVACCSQLPFPDGKQGAAVLYLTFVG